MAQNDWKCELNRILEMLDQQLEKIDGRLQASGLCFNEEFQQDIKKVINIQ